MVPELIKIETTKIENLIKELNEFQRKFDYRFVKEGFGQEKDSWIKAIVKMNGQRGIVF